MPRLLNAKLLLDGSDYKYVALTFCRYRRFRQSVQLWLDEYNRQNGIFRAGFFADDVLNQ
jgi:hypothetical protein